MNVVSSTSDIFPKGRPLPPYFNPKPYTFLPDLNISYAAKIMTKQQADSLLNLLEFGVEYLKEPYDQIYVRGRKYKIPRQHASYADNRNITYSFSGLTLPSQPWLPVLENVRDYVSRLCLCQFNHCLVNRYANGLDCIGFHSDDERELDPNAPVVSVSLGAVRPFTLRHIQDGARYFTLNLEHGSMLSMLNPTNQFYKHSLPKRPSVKTPRISLTFRKILNAEQDVTPDES